MNHLRNFCNRQPCFHRQRKFMQKLSGMRPQQMYAQNLVLLVTNQLNKTMPFSFDDGTVHFIKPEPKNLDILLAVFFLGLDFRHANTSKFWIGVSDPGNNTVIGLSVHKWEKG